MALAVYSGYWSGRLFAPLLAWVLRWRCDSSVLFFCNYSAHGPFGRKVFYTYYQISRNHQSDGAKSGAKKGKKELKDDGPHSLFGIVWHIATETGWGKHYIMWGLPFDTILRMVQDAPPRMNFK